MIEFTYVHFTEEDLVGMIRHKLDEKYKNKHTAARVILHADENGEQDLCVEYVFSDCKDKLGEHMMARKLEYQECYRGDCPNQR